MKAEVIFTLIIIIRRRIMNKTLFFLNSYILMFANVVHNSSIPYLHKLRKICDKLMCK